jgi:hypothetical protein
VIGTFSDNLKRGAQLLADAAAVAVAYTRGAATVLLSMRPTNSVWETQNDQGVLVQWEAVSWIVDVNEWARSGLEVPQRGDTIAWLDGSLHRKFEVMAPRGKTPYDRPAYSESLAIHTKEVSA